MGCLHRFQLSQTLGALSHNSTGFICLLRIRPTSILQLPSDRPRVITVPFLALAKQTTDIQNVNRQLNN